MKPTTLNVADLFCGAGGTSTGAVEAIRRLGYRSKLTAVNHWDVAVATHTANHPGARHLCASIDSTNPRDLFGEGELDLLWASPECMGHSVARGGRPINDQSRATAWCVLRWADALRPPVILIENVPEFTTWAPLDSKGRPLKKKRGEVFAAFLNALRALGYRVDHRILCAADYGDPTTRRRLFIQAVRGRRRIVWPHPTHAPVGNPTLFAARQWVSARSIIDWSREGKSIYDRKRPLSEKTIRRIFAGLERFGLRPFMVPGFNERAGQKPRTHSVDDPVPTVAATGHTHLAEPFLITMEHGGSVRSIDRPVPTVTTAKGGAMAVAQPFLVSLRGTAADQVDRSSRSVDQPTPTVATGNHLYLADPYLVQVNHGNGADVNGDGRRAKSVDAPLPTVCGQRGEWAVCEPFILPQNSTNNARPVSTPAPTVTTTSRGIGLVEPMILPQHSGGELRPVSQPAPTVATAGAIALVEPFLVSYYGNGQPHDIGEPAPTVTTKDRFGLVRPVVELQGQRYVLDIRFRMLQPNELAAAQGFPKGYQFTGTKTEVVKQIGNAVPRRLARALVAAVLSQDADVTRFADDEDPGVAA